MNIDDLDLDLKALEAAFPEAGQAEVYGQLEHLGYVRENALTEKGAFLLRRRWDRPYVYEIRDAFQDYYFLSKPFDSPLGCILSAKEISERAGQYEDRSTMTSEISPNVDESTLKMAFSFFLIHLNPKKGSIRFRFLENGLLIDFPTMTIPPYLRTIPADLYRMGILKEPPYPHWNRSVSSSEMVITSTRGRQSCFFLFGKTRKETPSWMVPLNATEAKIVDLFRQGAKVDRKLLMRKLGLNSGTAGFYLSSLCKKDIISLHGAPRAKNSFYTLAAKGSH